MPSSRACPRGAAAWWGTAAHTSPSTSMRRTPLCSAAAPFWPACRYTQLALQEFTFISMQRALMLASSFPGYDILRSDPFCHSDHSEPFCTDPVHGGGEPSGASRA
eukprot:1156620-Alexandrium_andersonii.AAC.1